MKEKSKFIGNKYFLKTNKILICIIMIIIILLVAFIIQKNKIKQRNEIEHNLQIEKLEQKIEKEVNIIKIEENTIYITLKFVSNINNLEYIVYPDGNQIRLQKQTKLLAIDYQLENRKEYKFIAKANDSQEVEFIIIVDKDMLPIINVKEEKYATITTQGVVLQQIITMDITEGYKTMYSLDNKKTWHEYTGEIKTINVNEIVGQKIPIKEEYKNVITLEKRVSIPEVVLAEDAIGPLAYDNNEETYVEKSGYIKIDKEMEGFKIKILSNKVTIRWTKEDKSTYIDKSKIINNTTQSQRNGTILTIPEEAVYLKFSGTNIKLKEVQVIPCVNFYPTQIEIKELTISTKTIKFSSDVTYKYYLENVLKQTTKQSAYKFTSLVPYYEYEIKVIAEDSNGNKDTTIKKIRTKPEEGILQFMASDAIKASNQAYVRPINGIPSYTFEILYLDQNNISNYGTYNQSTNTYTITKNMNLGTAQMSKMAVLKCDGNLTINSGVTITAASAYNIEDATGIATKVKGIFICCTGTFTNNGTITQSGRGTYKTAGQSLYLWKNANETLEYVPAYGGDGSGYHYKNGCTNGNISIESRGTGRRWFRTYLY